MSGRVRVAIVGGGPAGCTLAALLAQRGVRSVVFDDDRRAELLVGESLLPTVVLLLRRLGIEERVAAFATHKPGVTFLHRRGMQLDFTFLRGVERGLPDYAYNVPRPEFDRVLRERAEELGVQFVSRRAEILKAENDPRRELWLSEESLLAAKPLEGEQPDLLFDCSGRARMGARVLGLGSREGSRNDSAYFAHFKNFGSGVQEPGRVVLSMLDCGWSWRIPLEGRMSVGIVIDRNVARARGVSPEERLERSIRDEPLLADEGRGATRITRVMHYSNYQLISERGHGPGWAAVGDAFGFVDPMLSPGLFMAMESASLVDRYLFEGGGAVLDDPVQMARGFDRYVSEVEAWHRSWCELIEYCYDGRIFSLYESGQKLSEHYSRLALPRVIERHLNRRIAGMASGAQTRNTYSRLLLRFAAKWLAWDVAAPKDYAVLGGPSDV